MKRFVAISLAWCLWVNAAQSHTSAPQPQRGATPDVADQRPSVPVTNSEREAIRISSVALDLRISPENSAVEAHATIQLHNVSSAPLRRIALQLSSTLRWQGVSVRTPGGLQPVAYTQSPIATDTDHTGYAQEAVLMLPAALPADGNLTLTALYAGTIPVSAARLELIGAPRNDAEAADWDGITPEGTALRGFGNVLWYPVAAPVALLGNGNELFEQVSRYRALQSTATMQLHLIVASRKSSPATVIFNSTLQPLKVVSTAASDEEDRTNVLAEADLPASRLSLHAPSLFVTTQAGVTAPGSSAVTFGLSPEAANSVSVASTSLTPLLSQWLGPERYGPLLLLNHAGQPFDDGVLQVVNLGSVPPPNDLALQLIYPLTNTRLQSRHLWVEEGAAQLLSLLWRESREGRKAALAQLAQAATLIALAEPDLKPQSSPAASGSSGHAGQPLLTATSDVFLRNKAAAVLWQLRDIVGEETLSQALRDYSAKALDPSLDADPKAFQHLLEASAKRDLSWFFDDWVNHDRSLPDLSMGNVTPRPLPARPGRPSGYLVAVEVRNNGGAVAEVPVFLRSGTLVASERLRIPAHTLASTRIVFEGIPETVQVNDGSVPELGTAVHYGEIHIASAP